MSVIVVGAGPTGLTLAGDLAAAGVPVKILERRAEESNLTRAFAVHARTLEMLDMRGLADGLIAQGIQVPQVRVHLKGAELAFDIRHPDSRFPYVLILRQARTEAALEERARDLGVEIVRGAEVTGLTQDADGVTLALSAGGSERADYVAGCDGAHSAVRRLLGVGFAGKSYDTRILLADVLLKRPLPLAVNPFIGDDGAALLPPYGDGWFRATIWDRTGQHLPIDQPVDIEEVRDSLRRIAGDDLGLAEMSWSTRFLSERRQARAYRVGRVFLAGDAAHVHSPLGAMGMSTGIQDAANLSWKLAAACQGWAPPWLLDSYQSERHPVGRTVLRLTDLLRRLADAPAPVRLLRPYLAPALINNPKISEKARLTLSGLGIHYPVPDGVPASPLTGRRLPDLPIGSGRLYERLRGRYLLIDATTAHETARPWHDRVDVLPTGGPAVYDEATTLLIRPDGYLAWTATHPGPQQTRQALRQWCGQAR
ncbi:hypothetical protein FAF44_49890 [Nonomuraea sp. MG754425]|uniref:FAD-dependent monooxygenase n=1 Tax=Nonomuraea sp. MG754425 TaxID=2570319 RepID=UPI001F006CDB|nr:FAD-dependent monooxygenase [Nonomuraea sp. MG754425]MCF6476400.1 hypothetical protein [Nonomuraea sp. MG754425]